MVLCSPSEGASCFVWQMSFFHYDLHAHEHEIGMVFAAGSFFLAIGAFAVPLVVERVGRGGYDSVDEGSLQFRSSF